VSRFYKKLLKSDLAAPLLTTIPKKKFSFINNAAFSTKNNLGLFSKKSFNKLDSSELFLPRVKFKPGYQRI
jgi:hypothetical protein